MPYKDKEIRKNWDRLQKVANALLGQLGPKFTGTEKGHIQTDIAAVGCLSGLMILQETEKNLFRLASDDEAGNILIADVYDGQDDMFRFVAGMLVGNGIKFEMNPDVVKDCDPLFECAKMTQKLSPVLYKACSDLKLRRKYYKFAAALAGFKLVTAGDSAGLLSPSVGQNILYYHVVAGSKTIPQAEALWK